MCYKLQDFVLADINIKYVQKKNKKNISNDLLCTCAVLKADRLYVLNKGLLDQAHDIVMLLINVYIVVIVNSYKYVRKSTRLVRRVHIL